MREYKDHYVAFLDILGFKNIIENYNYSEVRAIFDKLLDFTPKSDLYEVYGYIHKKIMSDSIILFIDSSIKDSFQALIDFCGYIQMCMLSRENPVLLRGGVAKGDLYYDDKEEIIFGKGLTDAYNLESKSAIYPRIVFNGETLRSGKNNIEKMVVQDAIGMCYLKDSDCYYYVDFLQFPHTEEGKNDTSEFEELLDDWLKYIYHLKRVCDDVLDSETDNSIRTKYLWLNKKIENQISNSPYLKNHYDSIKLAEDNKISERIFSNHKRENTSNV